MTVPALRFVPFRHGLLRKPFLHLTWRNKSGTHVWGHDIGLIPQACSCAASQLRRLRGGGEEIVSISLDPKGLVIGSGTRRFPVQPFYVHAIDADPGGLKVEVADHPRIRMKIPVDNSGAWIPDVVFHESKFQGSVESVRLSGYATRRRFQRAAVAV